MAPVISADGEEDAPRIANDTDYGPSSAVFTRGIAIGYNAATPVFEGLIPLAAMLLISATDVVFALVFVSLVARASDGLRYTFQSWLLHGEVRFSGWTGNSSGR